jgi:hypothetical protein
MLTICFRVPQKAWDQYITDSSIKEQLRLLFASDKVFRLSLLTLIYQAMPTQSEPSRSFSEECVSSAREALDCHRQSARELGQEGLSVMSAYINWYVGNCLIMTCRDTVDHTILMFKITGPYSLRLLLLLS